MNLFKYLGADTVKLGPDTKEVWLPVADHDVADVGLLEAMHHTGGHGALWQMVLSHLDIRIMHHQSQERLKKLPDGRA